MDWKRRCELIPGGCSTYSKMPCRFVDGVYPKEVEYAKGARIGPEGKWIDYEMGLGAVVLGHSYERVRRAVAEQMERGTIYGFPTDKEGRLAERLNTLIPSAQMVRFTNTGTEACMAAVKIARAFTGRERVVHCGYHGWASWYSAGAPMNLGTTDDEQNQISSFLYNNLATLEQEFATGPDIAAVIMEPYLLEAPVPGFLRGVRTICDEHATVLIFDEVVTGFRTLRWTAQSYFGVTPDLTCIGKCMANGMYPISAVVGKRDLMMLTEASAGCFVSGTFAANPVGCAAALETIQCLDDFGAIDHIWEYGRLLKATFDQMLDALGMPEGIKMGGLPCRPDFVFPTDLHKSLFWQECLKNGVCFGPATFICYEHTNTELDITTAAMRRALDIVHKNWDHPEKALEGQPIQPTFRASAGKVLRKHPNAAGLWRCLEGKKCKPFARPMVGKRGPQVQRCPTCGSKKITREW